MFVLTENCVPLNQLVDNQIMFSRKMTINWVAYDVSLAEYLSQKNAIKIHKIYMFRKNLTNDPSVIKSWKMSQPNGDF